MVLPFLLQWDYLFEATRTTHAIGILVIAAALYTFDFIMARRTPAQAGEVQKTRARHMLYVLPSLTVGGIILHLSLIGKIPVLELISGNTDPMALIDMRDDFSREADFHFLLKYAFNWLTPIFSPISIAILVIYRRYVLAFLLFLLTVFYAMASLAKAPVLVLVMCLVVAAIGLLYRRSIAYLVIVGIFTAFIGIFVGFFLLKNASDSKEKIDEKTYQELLAEWKFDESHPLAHLTLGDHTRVVSGGLIPAKDDTPFIDSTAHECPDMKCHVTRAYKYLIYRWFLVPSEMAQRWYDYSLYHSYAGFSELVRTEHDSGYKHLSQRVGNWSLASRFPKIYLDSAHAYAGIDADAYLRMGWAGWILAVFGLMLIRLGSFFWYNTEPVAMAAYYSMVAALGLLLPHASIQALVVAQGVMIPSLIVMYIGWKR